MIKISDFPAPILIRNGPNTPETIEAIVIEGLQKSTEPNPKSFNEKLFNIIDENHNGKIDTSYAIIPIFNEKTLAKNKNMKSGDLAVVAAYGAGQEIINENGGAENQVSEIAPYLAYLYYWEPGQKGYNDEPLTNRLGAAAKLSKLLPLINNGLRIRMTKEDFSAYSFKSTYDGLLYVRWNDVEKVVRQAKFNQHDPRFITKKEFSEAVK